MDPSTDRSSTTPFLVRLFYRTGAFHRPDEFSSHQLPPSVDLYAWPSSTLAELAHQLAAASGPALLPDPSVGTRLAFRLAYPDARAAPAAAAASAAHHSQPPPHVGSGPGRYVVRDLGSVVIGGRGPGAETAPTAGGVEQDGDDADDADADDDDDAARTLGDAKFVVGDYLSCAILPPLPGGEVAPASSARTGRGAGIGEAQPLTGRAPPPPPPPPSRRENGYGGRRAWARAGRGGGGWGGDNDGAGGGGPADSGFGRPGRGDALPVGEWRRGERLPDVSSGGRGRGRPRW